MGKVSVIAAGVLAATVMSAGAEAQVRGITKSEIVFGAHSDLSDRPPPTACRRPTA